MKRIVNFVFEVGQLGVKPRTGWELLLAPRNEPVAVHVFRSTQLAFILAVLEGYAHPERVAVKCLFHENSETRLPDIHRVAMRYVNGVQHEQVVMDQTQGMGEVGDKILAHWRDANSQLTLEGMIASDANYLECAFSAREYMAQGHELAKGWVHDVLALLHTESAKELLGQMILMEPSDWWQGLKQHPEVIHRNHLRSVS